MLKQEKNQCLFCEIQANNRGRIIAENSLVYAIRDGFPVTEGHTLFIPKRHTLDSIDGFNIGMNCGETAGQTIFHCHVHLIPRRKGDVENPRGGVRHIIAGKGFYEDKK